MLFNNEEFRVSSLFKYNCCFISWRYVIQRATKDYLWMWSFWHVTFFIKQLYHTVNVFFCYVKFFHIIFFVFVNYCIKNIHTHTYCAFSDLCVTVWKRTPACEISSLWCRYKLSLKKCMFQYIPVWSVKIFL